MADKFLMVLRDLSTPDSYPPELSKVAYRLPLGPVADRFLAFILDFLILSPVVSFFLATSMRDLKTIQLINSDSDQAVVVWLVFLAGMVALSCFIQTCFLYFWQATPGQKFLQLRVIAFPPRGDDDCLTVGQALTRTVGWWGSALFLGVPFLEVVGHPLRRGFHERMSDTLVVSLKQEYSDLPLPEQTRSVGFAMWVFFVTVFVVGAMFMAKAYKAALLEGLGMNKAVAAAENACPASFTPGNKPEQRLDLAIAMYLADQATDECVSGEAQKVLWGSDKAAMPLAELAMAVVSEDTAEAASYHAKACESDARDEACVISKYLRSKDKKRADGLRQAGAALISSKVLLLNDAMAAKNYAEVAGLLNELRTEEPLKEFVDRNLVQATWAVANLSREGASGRRPANAVVKAPSSVNDRFNERVNESLMKQFKTRYGIQ